VRLSITIQLFIPETTYQPAGSLVDGWGGGGYQLQLSIPQPS
jgi:hypothetical protein